jgi:hypothetical protein
MISFGVHLPSNGRARRLVAECLEDDVTQYRRRLREDSDRIAIADEREEMLAIRLGRRHAHFPPSPTLIVGRNVRISTVVFAIRR